MTTMDKKEFRLSFTVNLALLLAIVFGIVRGTQWVDRLDYRVATIEAAIRDGVDDRWRRSDTILYHKLAQHVVDSWAEKNGLHPIELPDPRDIQSQ